MTIKGFVSILSFWVVVGMSYWAHAEDSRLGDEAVAQKSQTPQLKTLFLSKETREKIDQQREAYLNPVVEKKTLKLVSKTTGGGKTKKKRIYIPPKVSVSLVMVKPDGSRLVRVNNKYNRSPSKHIKMDFSKSSPKGVPVNIQGRTQVVPVGSTLLTRKNKVVETYKLEKSKRKASALKTEQKAVKQRLEQIKILKPK
ncbi:MAG TPA: hypothetical protein EYP76_06305 [Thiomicrorhabdus sp.]|nr:hypothetical protein [Thiomicrorhabdus sp.]